MKSMKNLLADLPDDMSEEVFTTLVENENVIIERIVSLGHTSPEEGWYDQERNEWVMVLQGRAEIAFLDGPTQPLETGDHLLIPAHKKHRVRWTDPQLKTVWLAVHYK